MPYFNAQSEHGLAAALLPFCSDGHSERLPSGYTRVRVLIPPSRRRSLSKSGYFVAPPRSSGEHLTLIA